MIIEIPHIVKNSSALNIEAPGSKVIPSAIKYRKPHNISIPDGDTSATVEQTPVNHTNSVL